MPAVGEPHDASAASARLILEGPADGADIVTDVMGRWKAGVDFHRPEQVAALFTEDALFQGLHPDPTRGTAAIIDYYAGQPQDLWAEFALLTCRRYTAGMIVGYLAVDFHAGTRSVTSTHLTVVLVHGSTGWHIAHYHVSLIP